MPVILPLRLFPLLIPCMQREQAAKMWTQHPGQAEIQRVRGSMLAQGIAAKTAGVQIIPTRRKARGIPARARRRFLSRHCFSKEPQTLC